MDKPPETVYRLIGIYSGKPERKVYSRFQLAMKIASRRGWGGTLDSFRIESATVSAWTDVTEEFMHA